MRKYGDIYKFHVYHTASELSVLNEQGTGWAYKVYKQIDDVLIRESDEWFDTRGEAELAAIGHISLLENGEG